MDYSPKWAKTQNMRYLRFDHPLLSQIGLVARKCDHNVLIRLLPQFFHPSLGAFECVR